mgnify:CR=1 FL=1
MFYGLYLKKNNQLTRFIKQCILLYKNDSNQSIKLYIFQYYPFDKCKINKYKQFCIVVEGATTHNSVWRFIVGNVRSMERCYLHSQSHMSTKQFNWLNNVVQLIKDIENPRNVSFLLNDSIYVLVSRFYIESKI